MVVRSHTSNRPQNDTSNYFAPQGSGAETLGSSLWPNKKVQKRRRRGMCGTLGNLLMPGLGLRLKPEKRKRKKKFKRGLSEGQQGPSSAADHGC